VIYILLQSAYTYQMRNKVWCIVSADRCACVNLTDDRSRTVDLHRLVTSDIWGRQINILRGKGKNLFDINRIFDWSAALYHVRNIYLEQLLKHILRPHFVTCVVRIRVIDIPRWFLFFSFFFYYFRLFFYRSSPFPHRRDFLFMCGFMSKAKCHLFVARGRESEGNRVARKQNNERSRNGFITVPNRAKLTFHNFSGPRCNICIHSETFRWIHINRTTSIYSERVLLRVVNKDRE